MQCFLMILNWLTDWLIISRDAIASKNGVIFCVSRMCTPSVSDIVVCFTPKVATSQLL